MIGVLIGQVAAAVPPDGLLQQTVQLGTVITVVGGALGAFTTVVVFLGRSLLKSVQARADERYDVLETSITNQGDALIALSGARVVCKEKHDRLRVQMQEKSSAATARLADRFNRLNETYQKEITTANERTKAALNLVYSIQQEVRDIRQDVPIQLDRLFDRFQDAAKLYIRDEVDKRLE
jgi:uncharacterized coiled-coil protein SlyX